jgi:hypothetical protein
MKYFQSMLRVAIAQTELALPKAEAGARSFMNSIKKEM